jgi:hypothetical protein
MNISVSESGLKDLIESLENAADNIPKEIYTALGKAGTKVKSIIAKEVTKEINIVQKTVRANTKIIKDKTNLTVTVSLAKSDRIAIQHFKGGARQTKTGVKSKVNNAKGSKIYPSTFKSEKLHGNVFKRKGKARFPLSKRLRGPSPMGVLAKNPDKLAVVVGASRELVIEAIRDRVRFLELKKRGGLNWQQNETTDTNETAEG